MIDPNMIQNCISVKKISPKFRTVLSNCSLTENMSKYILCEEVEKYNIYTFKFWFFLIRKIGNFMLQKRKGYVSNSFFCDVSKYSF